MLDIYQTNTNVEQLVKLLDMVCTSKGQCMDLVEPLHPYWIEFAKGCFKRGKNAASWLALLNGTEWNLDRSLIEILNKLESEREADDLWYVPSEQLFWRTLSPK